ncbi:hypothetical protein GW17_00058714 [Ensete ventricosum]|nr:hypothetical protein GW17_00058714 [Ensete ventricosum]
MIELVEDEDSEPSEEGLELEEEATEEDPNRPTTQCTEGSKEEGQPTTDSPHAGSPTHGQAAAKASPQGEAAGRAAACRGGAYRHGGLWPTRKGGSRPQRDAHKGVGCRAARASGDRQRATPQGAAHGTPARGATARGKIATTRSTKLVIHIGSINRNACSPKSETWRCHKDQDLVNCFGIHILCFNFSSVALVYVE